ncbi:hypothetical protein LMF89_24555 [Pelosinus sp. Bkl1]|uniref:Uncharacterized protein n=1 Tax=Pelosinus baikalensis TaxID=2892015 RepID=A0ABS8HZC6_9FIRM|nr:hypothetical protein [Pelosinus baikalensis]
MPTVLVGTEVASTINYIAIAHVGVIDHDLLSISMAKAHYSNQKFRGVRLELF